MSGKKITHLEGCSPDVCVFVVPREDEVVGLGVLRAELELDVSHEQEYAEETRVVVPRRRFIGEKVEDTVGHLFERMRNAREAIAHR